MRPNFSRGVLAGVADTRAARVGAGGSPTEISAAQERVDALAVAVTSLRERIGVAALQRARCESALAALEETLAAEPSPWVIETADAADKAHARLLDSARARYADVAAAAAAAATNESSARQRLAAAQAESDRVLAAIADAQRAMTDATAAWQKSGMLGEPSTEAIETREDKLAERAAALADQLQEVSALSRAHDAWLAQEQLRDLTAAMEAEGGAGAAHDPSTHEQRLQAALDTARAALRLTVDTRAAVVAYGEQLKTEAEDFSTRFLLPLNDLIDAFNRALLSTPGETVQFNAAHTVERTALAMQLRYADPIENVQYRTELPPQLVLRARARTIAAIWAKLE